MNVLKQCTFALLGTQKLQNYQYFTFSMSFPTSTKILAKQQQLMFSHRLNLPYYLLALFMIYKNIKQYASYYFSTRNNRITNIYSINQLIDQNYYNKYYFTAMSKKGKSGFITKLQAILNNNQLQTVASWNTSGQSFIIYDAQFFEESVLNSYFRHKKMNSFIRQLNMYGFHKTRSEKLWMEFHHPYFKKNKPEDYHLIDRRRSINSQIKLQMKSFDQVQLKDNCFAEDNQSSKLGCSLSLIQPMGQLNWANFRLSSSQMSIKFDQSLTSLRHIELSEIPFENDEGEGDEKEKIFINEIESDSKSNFIKQMDEIQTLLFKQPQSCQYIF